MNPQGALLFLLFLAFDIYIFLVLTRFLLQLVRADFYNPVSQFVVKATNPPLKPLRKLVPGYGGVDVAALVLVLARVILSWVAPDPYNPMVRVVVQITEPVMAPARKLLPPMGGFDLSPIIVLLLIQFLQILFGLH